MVIERDRLNLTLSERYRAVQALATFQQFYHLLQLWNGQLPTPGLTASDEVVTLRAMANDLRSLQASAARDAEWLQVVMKQHAPAIDAAALESLDTFHIDTEYRETLKRRLEQRGGLTAHIAEAISHLVRDSAIAPRASASPCAVLGALALAAALTLQVETLALILFLMDINGCF